MQSFRWGLAVTLVLASIITRAEETPKQPALSDQDRIVGTWRVTMLEIDGNRVPDADARKLSVINDKNGDWTVKSEDQTEPISKGHSTFDATKSPKELDMTPTDGVEAGIKFRGIYELEEKTRRLCFAPSDFPRPTDFTSFPGTKRYLMTLERVSDK